MKYVYVCIVIHIYIYMYMYVCMCIYIYPIHVQCMRRGYGAESIYGPDDLDFWKSLGAFQETVGLGTQSFEQRCKRKEC